MISNRESTQTLPICVEWHSTFIMNARSIAFQKLFIH